MTNLISLNSGIDQRRQILSLCTGNGANLSHQPYLLDVGRKQIGN
ncbi:hypothetical protein F383_30553 [Gossypium arboreum]|uniref:Uncharacterized protein n=1 Tax=Gossypium arboreum TaxID=29729 RepID=A0A0B0PJW1_GOSAR|nr:hypothetical protein F383_30553 [Gossypium arboreum]